MTHYDDGTPIKWTDPEDEEQLDWRNVIDLKSIAGIKNVLERGEKPTRMQFANGPNCDDEYMRTASGHGFLEYQKMDPSQLYIEVTAADWPRGCGLQKGHKRN